MNSVKEFSGKITDATKSVLLMFNNKYEGLLKSNKRFLDGATVSIDYCGDYIPTFFDVKVDYNGTGEQQDYCNQIVRMWSYDFCRRFFALPTRVLITQHSKVGDLSLQTKFTCI